MYRHPTEQPEQKPVLLLSPPDISALLTMGTLLNSVKGHEEKEYLKNLYSNFHEIIHHHAGFQWCESETF